DTHHAPILEVALQESRLQRARGCITRLEKLHEAVFPASPGRQQQQAKKKSNRESHSVSLAAQGLERRTAGIGGAWRSGGDVIILVNIEAALARDVRYLRVRIAGVSDRGSAAIILHVGKDKSGLRAGGQGRVDEARRVGGSRAGG